jgi:hypothetical protein
MVKLSEADLKEFLASYDAWKKAKNAYSSARYGSIRSLSTRRQTDEEIKEQIKDLEQKHGHVSTCAFVNWLRNQVGYKKAIESLSKKISNFQSIGEYGEYDDQLYFDYVCAKAFHVYMDTSKGSINGWIDVTPS